MRWPPWPRKTRQVPLSPGSSNAVSSNATWAQIIWPDKSYEMALPVEYKDVDVPPNAPLPLRRVGGG